MARSVSSAPGSVFGPLEETSRDRLSDRPESACRAVEVRIVTWRPLTIDDAAAVARALALAEAVDDTGEHYSAADIRDLLADESIASIAAFAPDGERSEERRV